MHKSKTQEGLVTIAHQACPILIALENLLSHALLASHNPDGMRHLLFLYGLNHHFKVELNAMETTERNLASNSMDTLKRQ